MKLSIVEAFLVRYNRFETVCLFGSTGVQLYSDANTMKHMSLDAVFYSVSNEYTFELFS